MKIVVIAGSNRKSSTSTRLAEYLMRLMQRQGEDVALIDLYRTPLPLFSPDEWGNDPSGVQELKRALNSADAVVLATPEYHGSMTGVMKNALDYLGQEHFHNKPVLSVVSAGGAVGVSALQQLQSVVRSLHGINSPEWLSIGGAQRKWFECEHDPYEGGQDIDDRIHRVVNSFLELTHLVRGRNAPSAAGAGS